MYFVSLIRKEFKSKIRHSRQHKLNICTLHVIIKCFFSDVFLLKKMYKKRQKFNETLISLNKILEVLKNIKVLRF